MHDGRRKLNEKRRRGVVRANKRRNAELFAVHNKRSRCKIGARLMRAELVREFEILTEADRFVDARKFDDALRRHIDAGDKVEIVARQVEAFGAIVGAK